MADETKTPEPIEETAADIAGSEPQVENVEAEARDLEIAMLKDEVAGLKDRLLRMAAEAENTRKRLNRKSVV